METLVIGSTVIDVIVCLPHLPQRGEDININAPQHRLGGCAYNVYETLRSLDSPALLCSPVGTSVYGRMVREYLEERGIKPFVYLEEENGCCYCLVESNGERSFLSHHGAEYLFSKDWMKGIDFSKAGSVYVSGIDVEDSTGNEIVEFVYEHPELDLYFAPGPRIMHIEKEHIIKLLHRRDTKGKGPVLHLNKTEACSFSAKGSVEKAAVFLAEKTDNALVITLGEKGCYYYAPESSQGKYAPGFPVQAVDTTGAGDAHCGAVIAGLKQGKPLPEVCETANKIGAKTASGRGLFSK